MRIQAPSNPTLPETGFLRLNQIIGDKKAVPPIPPLIPISRSGWWRGIQEGRFPKGCKLGPNTTAWEVGTIRDLISQLSEQAEG